MVSWTLRICGLILAAALLFAGWDGFTENRAFAARGRRALVDPIEGYTERTTTTRQLGVAVNERTSNTAELFFHVDDGRRVRVNRVVPDDVLPKLVAGADVYLEYLPENPEGARFAGYTRAPLGATAAGLAALAITIVLWRKM